MVSDPTDFFEIDCQGIDSTSPTGRINNSQPKIAYIDAGPGASNVARMLLMSSLAAQVTGNKEPVLVDCDLSDIELRVLSSMEPPKLDMEQIYRHQLTKEELVNHPYFEPRQKGQGRKNSRLGSRTAKDHRPATKRQRAARKKNRK